MLHGVASQHAHVHPSLYAPESMHVYLRRRRFNGIGPDVESDRKHGDLPVAQRRGEKASCSDRRWEGIQRVNIKKADFHVIAHVFSTRSSYKHTRNEWGPPAVWVEGVSMGRLRLVVTCRSRGGARVKCDLLWR